MKRIAFFCPHSDPLAKLGEPDSGGQCIYEARVAAALVRETGAAVRCFTRHYGTKPAQSPIDGRAEVYRYGMGPAGFLRKEDMGPYLPQFTHHVLKAQYDWLQEADIVHGHYWDGGVSGLAASLATGKPFIFTSHSLGVLKQQRVPDADLNYHIRIPAEKRVMQAADGIIALSSIERQALIEHYGVPESRIHIVPGGVDVDRFAPKASKAELKQQLGIESDFMIFAVGRLDPRKGFLELVEAMPQVVRAIKAQGKSICFMLPQGSESPSNDEKALHGRMLERIRELKLEGEVRWFSRLSDEDIVHCYGAADLFACPSLYEPFGLVLVEAMAAGTPVVATCNGGPVDIVDEGVDGYLADPTDADAFAAGIMAILSRDGAARQRMNEAALATARERYAWTAVASQIAAVYEQVADGYGRP
jgi:glycosyltransferase involved in cell wall biosynthesis